MQFCFSSKSYFKIFFRHFALYFVLMNENEQLKVQHANQQMLFSDSITHTQLNAHMHIHRLHTQWYTKWIVTVISEAWWWGREILPHIAGSCQNISIYLSFLVDPHYNRSVYVIICQSDGNWHPWLLTLGTSLCACVHLCILALEGSSQMCANKHCFFCILRFE